MAQVHLGEVELVVDLTGWEKLFGISGDLAIPYSQVRGATDDPHFIRDSLGIRTGGAGAPGFIALGHFRKDGDKIFASWYRGEEVAVIELEGFKYDRLVIGTNDARLLALQINQKLSGRA